MKLRDRLTLTFTLVTAIALFASFVVTYFLVERDELREIDRSLAIQAEHTVSIALLRGVEDPRMLEGAGEGVEPPSIIVRYAALYEATGSFVRATKSYPDAPRTLAQIPGVGDAHAGTQLELTVRDARLRGVLLPASEHFQLLYAVSRAGVDSDLRFLVRVFSGLFVASTFLTYLVARWLARQLSRDVDTISGVAEQVANGDLRARVGTTTGGTVETRKLAERLDEMISRLSDLVTSQRVFITSAAHELRSPLTSLKGELELALRRERSPAEYKETLSRVLADAVALVGLADDLLALARVEGGVRAGYAAVAEVVADARGMSRGNADARSVVVTVQSGATLDHQVACPKKDAARALRNLLDNAIAHSRAGAEVRIATERSDKQVRIAVEDQGPGVQKDDEEHIFAPFYRGARERAGEEAGAGLGLALAREIARAHGGDVSHDQSYRAGARFVLSLPIASAP